MQNLVVFWGWTRNDTSYKPLVKIAPPGWNIYQISFEELAPNGKRDNFQKHVIEFLDKNNLSKVSIMGQSLGGAFALEFASFHPERVECLYLVDSEGVYGGESLIQMGKNLLVSTSMYASKKAVENTRAVYRLIRNPIQNIKLARYGHYANLQQEAQKVIVPTTILWGEKDHLTPLWQGRKLHELIQNSKLITLQNMDHDWILHQPELFWQNI